MTALNRNDMLADLADAVNELTEPRHEATRYEVAAKPRTTTAGKRRRSQSPYETHVVTLPSLLQSLADAVEPGMDGDMLAVGSFESQPSADMAAIAAAVKIRAQVLAWCQRLELKPAATISGTVSRLVSANHTLPQLHDLLKDAKSWVRTCRIATGYDPAPRTVDIPCPNCNGKHVLTLFGEGHDLLVKCSKCQLDWPDEHIGLLTQMIEQNLTQTTLTADGPCPISPGCYRRGVHDEHWNSRGNTWLTPEEMRNAG